MTKIIYFVTPATIVKIGSKAAEFVPILGPSLKFTKKAKKVTEMTDSVSADFLEAVACQDSICATISLIGVAADGLQVCTSFIPGPNITAIITLPISVGCKVFVWPGKRSKLPLGGC